ncbi:MULTISPECIES: transporter substrate-binding domain-containing protein [Arthrobacter]|uniref:Transporter substrate-binding domain-containing protein n=2 Tax=Arthrobacter TaxID=1663 RepID=A0ABU9KJH1_9MICC|nr:transporter substrate-binding domain-containing protein [Arthrobacter sp. YJM1]MDP5226718.1 transporter substrate-binding domain-containing protein [Arthrobacter sp. YJM1]
MTTAIRRAAGPAAVALGLVVSLGACSQTPAPAATGAGQVDLSKISTQVPPLAQDAAAAALLPASIQSSKVLKVAIPTNEPPTQFYQEGTQDLVGLNPDMARLLGEALGVKVEISVANFDAIIPGIAAGRYDATVSSMSPTAERGKVLDFVDYVQFGSGVAVAKGNPLGLTEKTLCGKKVGFLTASYQLRTDVPDFDKACQTAGKDKIQTSEFQDTRQAISALASGRLDAVLADSPIVNYAATQNPDIEIGATYGVADVGIGLAKEQGLVKAVAKAMATVIHSDAYATVLKRYGLQSGAVTEASVNKFQ